MKTNNLEDFDEKFLDARIPLYNDDNLSENSVREDIKSYILKREKEQAERAEDHFASVLADYISKKEADKLINTYSNEVCDVVNKLLEKIHKLETKQKSLLADIISEISQYSQISDKATKDLIKIIRELK